MHGQPHWYCCSIHGIWWSQERSRIALVLFINKDICIPAFLDPLTMWPADPTWLFLLTPGWMISLIGWTLDPDVVVCTASDQMREISVLQANVRFTTILHILYYEWPYRMKDMAFILLTPPLLPYLSRSFPLYHKVCRCSSRWCPQAHGGRFQPLPPQLPG